LWNLKKLLFTSVAVFCPTFDNGKAVEEKKIQRPWNIWPAKVKLSINKTRMICSVPIVIVTSLLEWSTIGIEQDQVRIFFFFLWNFNVLITTSCETEKPLEQMCKSFHYYYFFLSFTVFFFYKWRSLPSSDTPSDDQIKRCSKSVGVHKKSSSYNDINIYRRTLEDNMPEDVQLKSRIFPWRWFSYSKLKGPGE
jgi:hypothetical protein